MKGASSSGVRDPTAGAVADKSPKKGTVPSAPAGDQGSIYLCEDREVAGRSNTGGSDSTGEDSDGAGITLNEEGGGGRLNEEGGGAAVSGSRIDLPFRAWMCCGYFSKRNDSHQWRSSSVGISFVCAGKKKGFWLFCRRAAADRRADEDEQFLRWTNDK